MGRGKPKTMTPAALKQRRNAARSPARARKRSEESAAVRRFVAEELEVSGFISQRFGLDGGKPKTLEEVGKKFGVSRERIRQLQNIALSKLRRARQARSDPT